MSRETIMSALSSLVSDAYSWKTGPVRRLKLWSDVPVQQRPACFIFEGGRETYVWSNTTIPKRKLEPRIFVYIDAHDPGTVGATELNNIMDALDTAFKPSGPDIGVGRNTLGNQVNNCRISGAPLKDPGDLDGDGMLIVPIEIILP